jgi:hypothetical protein
MKEEEAMGPGRVDAVRGDETVPYEDDLRPAAATAPALGVLGR